MDTLTMGMMEKPRADTKSLKRTMGRRIALARKIASVRENRPITQEVLAARLRMFPRRIWEIEEGILAIDTSELCRLGDVLDLPAGWFFGQFEWATCQTSEKLDMSDLVLAKTINEMDSQAKGAIHQIVMRISGAIPRN